MYYTFVGRCKIILKKCIRMLSQHGRTAALGTDGIRKKVVEYYD